MEVKMTVVMTMTVVTMMVVMISDLSKQTLDIGSLDLK
jgi:hypothetical protein